MVRGRDFHPTNPSGYVPGAEFVNKGNPNGLKVGIITRVDDLEMKCDIKIITGQGERVEVDLTQGMYGPRSFWGGVPEEGSFVLVGYRRKSKQLHDAVILGYIPVGNRSGQRFDPIAAADPSSISAEDRADFARIYGPIRRFKRLRLRSGDVGGMSAAGSEFVLSKDVRMSNRAGDLFELRDSDRTLVAQSLHRVESEAGVFRSSGPIRRGGLWFPSDILQADGRTPKTTTGVPGNRYFGGDDIRRFTNEGMLLDVVNNPTEFPPVTYSNGRRVHYTSTTVGANFEDPTLGAAGEPFTEDRLEILHTTDMVQEVREEIDGYQVGRKPIFIERVLGTIVGNDSSSEQGLSQYGQALRPKLFDDFEATGPGTFMLESVNRTATDDLETYTSAGAYLFRINPPAPPPGTAIGNSVFAMAVSKQGKLFVNIPGSRVEKYSSTTKNVSAEVNMEGALKMRLGAATPSGIALHLTLQGGAVFDFRGAASGAGLQFRTHSSYKIECAGVPDENDLAYSENISGNKESATSGDYIENIKGAKVTTVNGRYQVLADRVNVNAQSGMSVNAGEYASLISGKSQYHYALQVMETIVAGGRVSTILAGGVTETLAAGAWTTTVAGGAMSTNVLSGAYTVTVGTGAVSISTAAGAMSLSAAAGAVSINAGLAMTMTAGATMSLTAPVAISLNSVQVLLGSVVAPLGVSRGTPMMPPGTPSLDWITGNPLMGAALIRST